MEILKHIQRILGMDTHDLLCDNNDNMDPNTIRNGPILLLADSRWDDRSASIGGGNAAGCKKSLLEVRLNIVGDIYSIKYINTASLPNIGDKIAK